MSGDFNCLPCPWSLNLPHHFSTHDSVCKKNPLVPAGVGQVGNNNDSLLLLRVPSNTSSVKYIKQFPKKDKGRLLWRQHRFFNRFSWSLSWIEMRCKIPSLKPNYVCVWMVIHFYNNDLHLWLFYSVVWCDYEQGLHYLNVHAPHTRHKLSWERHLFYFQFFRLQPANPLWWLSHETG